MLKNLMVVMILFFYGCCFTESKEFEFEKGEPRLLGSFQKGETLYFKNEKGETDSILIVNLDSAKGEKCFGLKAPKPIGKSYWVAIHYFPGPGRLKGFMNKNHQGKDSMNSIELIRITKDPVENKTLFDFNFRNFFASSDTAMGRLNKDTLYLNGKKISNYFEIKHGFPERIMDSLDIEALIWTEKDGLTAYKNKAGLWWTKKGK